MKTDGLAGKMKANFKFNKKKKRKKCQSMEDVHLEGKLANNLRWKGQNDIKYFAISRPRGYKIFFMLNSVEHEIFPAHKC